MSTRSHSATSNVVRFPVEQVGRPTLDLMRDLAPDLCMVDMIAEAYDLVVPAPEFRDQVDAEAAEHILNQIDSEPGARRAQQLTEMLDQVVKVAVEASRAARRAWGLVEELQEHFNRTKAKGGHWLQPLEERLDAREREAAAATIEAHLRAEEAEGVARAVSLARSGMPWSPRSAAADMDALLAYEVKERATG